MQGSFGRYSSFGHAKTRPGGIWRDGFEELDWVAPYDRLLPLGERPTQFRQSDILQLPDPLSGHSECLSNFFESFRFAAVQPESLEDNLPLAVVQHLQKLAKFVPHALVSEQLKRRLRIFITDDLAKRSLRTVLHRSVHDLTPHSFSARLGTVCRSYRSDVLEAGSSYSGSTVHV